MQTVRVLANVLKLSEEELLQLRRIAAGETGTASADLSGPGRPIGQWDPHELEVHPAGPGKSPTGTDGARALPGYARREHDQVLANTVTAAAAGRSGIVVLVGTSSTGKTRACWEAVQPLAEKGWRLWHPFDPTRAKAALEDLHRVGPRTVVWLNEAQHYLGDRKFGERIAAAVRQLLLDEERGPVLVLGTLWPEYAYDYTVPPTPGQDDPYSLVRELMAGHTVSVPDTFDTAALATATALAEQGDSLLADALTRNQNGGRITQDLAGAPELLRRYEQPRQAAARALLEAAMDARRLGTGLHIPQAFLTDAALDYLSDHDYDQLADDWAEQAYAELAEKVHGKQAPLRRTTPRPTRRPPTPTTDAGTTPPTPAGPVFRLADYLEQHGRAIRRHLCPPASFWHAAHTHLTHPDDLNNLAKAAKERHRLQWSHHLFRRAADHGDPEALTELARARKGGGDWDGAETLYRQAADHGSTRALTDLAAMRERAGDRDGAETLARQAADHGDTFALAYLATMRKEAGDRESAETLYRQAADHGDIGVLTYLAAMREEAGDRDGAETLYRQAADHGDIGVLTNLAKMREEAGDRESAETLARQAADHGDTFALAYLAAMREEAGDRDGAETLARQAADRGNIYALTDLAEIREEAGDRDGAETLARQAADHGNTHALAYLAAMREEAGDRDGAETLARQAADHGDTYTLTHLAKMREEAGDRERAETLYQQAADHGDTYALTHLAKMREEAGDRESAETLYRQAADHGDTGVLTYLAKMREEAGDRDGAETLYRQAADHGNIYALTHPGEPSSIFHRLWPYGLDPDGTPTSPWEPSGSVALREHVPPRPS
ncbi:sel1 repeat family protein [Streptomyces sp. OfavH-34-F]|uniref:sel1 repeat family protein n=1 Tax=Streptomyces sp. OfavH-34-F TaxID=2917760 RepID=UPI001EF36A00|nr:sel1 repeat family protein [Streptomyces sp. OfavH-34-F]MCG7522985.1 sel1 repeat family protein [Streptomyces sp. OfavH-34-F]